MFDLSLLRATGLFPAARVRKMGYKPYVSPASWLSRKESIEKKQSVQTECPSIRSGLLVRLEEAQSIFFGLVCPRWAYAFARLFIRMFLLCIDYDTPSVIASD